MAFLKSCPVLLKRKGSPLPLRGCPVASNPPAVRVWRIGSVVWTCGQDKSSSGAGQVHHDGIMTEFQICLMHLPMNLLRP